MSDRNDQPISGAWQAPATSGPAAGWYPDPWDDRRRRYWDGAAWTGDVATDGPSPWGASPAGAAAGASQPSAGWPPAPPVGVGAGWASGGGWGGPPAGATTPDWWGMPGGAAPTTTGPGNRVHVALVAVIAVIAVLAGIGIGSQVNSSASPSVSSGGSQPFGGTGGSSGGGSGGASSSLGSGAQAVVSSVDKSVVDINTELGYQNGAAAGTGMVLTADGMVLTNNHVIDGATSISVTFVSTGKTYKADVVGDDVSQDVAVVKVEGVSNLTPITVAQSSVKVGDQVIAIGNAGGAGGAPSAVTGTVTDLNRQITASDQNGANPEQLSGLIQTDAPIQAGDSGGPLVNTKGAVIGMDTAASSSNAFSGAASEGFAIPIAQAQQIASQIEKGQSSDKIHIGATGFLGVSVAASGLPGSLGSGGGNGAQVTEVISGSPADKAGITGGETITGVDGQTVTSSTDLTNILRAHHPGDSVSVTWTDQSGSSHTANITLAAGPAA